MITVRVKNFSGIGDGGLKIFNFGVYNDYADSDGTTNFYLTVGGEVYMRREKKYIQHMG